MQLSGELSKVSLPNLIQLVRNGELTGKIALLQGAKSATIYVNKGAIVHVDLEGSYGREALMELFLWLTGSFSFIEEPVSQQIEYSLNPYSSEDATERLLRDGLAYVEQKKYLDQMRVSGQTVLGVTDQVKLAQPAFVSLVKPLLEQVDGRRPLSEALAAARLSRRQSVQAVYALLSEGLAVVLDQSARADSGDEEMKLDLPPWVVARLKQDNANISQSIVDMVIWVDRVKCWMYQVDADFARIIGELTRGSGSDELDEDFWKELAQENPDFQGPLFGEAVIEKSIAGTGDNHPNSPDGTSDSGAGTGAARAGTGSAGAKNSGALSEPPRSGRSSGANQPRRPAAQGWTASSGSSSDSSSTTNSSAANASNAADDSGATASPNSADRPTAPANQGSAKSSTAPANPTSQPGSLASGAALPQSEGGVAPSAKPRIDDLKVRQKPPSVEF